MRRLPASIALALLCAGLLSCAPLGGRADAEAAFDAYRTGRAQHLAGHPDAARSAYLAALQADPQHVEARNGLATLHAESGELAQAIALWRALIAQTARGAGQAWLYANLGQAHRLDGNLTQARAAFEQACLLDPLQARAWQMLGETLAALGQQERAGRTLRQAAALRRHDVRADFAVTGGASEVVGIRQALATPTPRQEPGWTQSWIEVGADGMMALQRRLDAEPVAPHLAARLEIRNGNGITGMARTLSRRIDEPAIQVTRLSNEPGFAVRRTRIDYAASHLDAASSLAQRLGNVQLRLAEEHMQADLRLVLGHDLARHGTALRLGPSHDLRLSAR